MPPVHSRRSGIPRPAGSKFTEVASSVISNRKPRKSSSSDADAEYTTSTDAARVKLSKPLKMQGPFRPSIVGRMAKKGECLVSKGRKPIPRRDGSVEPHAPQQATRNKSKSRSPPERRPSGGKQSSQTTHKVDHAKGKVTVSSRIPKHMDTCNGDVPELKKENKELKIRLDSQSKEISACKVALEKCHIDPVTLEPISAADTQTQEKEAEVFCVQEEVEMTKKAMQNLLEQNSEMLDSLKDLLKGLS